MLVSVRSLGRSIWFSLPLLLGSAGCRHEQSLPPLLDDTFDERLFSSAPREVAPHVRWWWPGDAVDEATISQELDEMVRVGFGGVELQPLAFGLRPEDIARDARIRQVGSAGFLAHVRHFLVEARARHLVGTLTLGSGWPCGGQFSHDVRPVELLHADVEVTGPASVSMDAPLPTPPLWISVANQIFDVIGSFDPPFELLGVYALPVIDASQDPPVVGAAIDLTSSVSAGHLTWSAPAGSFRILFSYRHRVDHLVAGGAYPSTPAPAHVIDHLSPEAFTTLRDEQVLPWLSAVDPAHPDELFVDSFELVADLPWSDDFASSFPTRFGYPIGPEIPFITHADGEVAYTEAINNVPHPLYVTQDDHGMRVREDYEDLRGETFEQAFLAPAAELARTRGSKLRLQSHGGYAQVLDGYMHADIPESEGLFANGSFDFLSLAASAAHVKGGRFVSSESFVTVNLQGTTLDEESMWTLAGRAYAAGINRPMFHGHAYPYTRVAGDDFYPFRRDPAAGNVADLTSDIRFDSPGYAFLPDFVRALTRLDYAMSRGEPRVDVAWLLDERQIPPSTYLHFGSVAPGESESDLSLALRRAGYTYDRISRHMLATSTAAGSRLTVGAMTYGALVISDARALEPEGAAALERAVAAGVPVFVVGALPTRARGAADVATRDDVVRTKLDAIRSSVHIVADETALAGALTDGGVAPAVRITPGDGCTLVSRRLRETTNGHVLFLFDEYGGACHATVDLDAGGTRAIRLDPITGRSQPLADAAHFEIDLPALRPVVVFVAR